MAAPQPFYDASQYVGGSDNASPVNPPAPLGGVLNTFMADTAGVLYRTIMPSFGYPLVDPWTKAELIDQATSDYIKAGMDPATAQGQAAADINTTADTSPAKDIPTLKLYGDIVVEAIKNAVNGGDPNQPCGITNIGACVPAWVIWLGGGVLILGALYILRPYVVGAEELSGH